MGAVNVHAVGMTSETKVTASGGAPRGRGGMQRPLRRAQLLQVAEAIVLKDGVSAMTMSRVATDAGVARTVVYSHFDNASAILLAVVERHWRIIDDQFAAVVSLKPFEDRLRAYARVYLGEAAPDRLELRRLLDSALHDELVNAAFQKRQEVRRAGWARRMRADIGLSDAAADFAALALLETIHAQGAVLYEDAEARDATVEMYVRGILGLARSLL